MTDLHDLIRENGYQQAVTEMLKAFPLDGTPEREKIREKLWEMAFHEKQLTENK